MRHDIKNVNLLSRNSWIAIAVIGAIGFVFLVREHSVHSLAILPYVVLLLCPLMHIFMHKSHGGHGDDTDHGAK